ncbi:MAG TPA: methyltransferase domain-containing protein [Candidatus Polarisedimenticolia bacterium]|nr:methyltransferase domain-containing protein [Candidatus Polarisedimenticolia bacterium]
MTGRPERPPRWGCLLLERLSWYARLQAWILAKGVERYHGTIEPRRRALLAQARGLVLEVGAGPGTNVGLFPPGVLYVAMEPNVHSHLYLLEAHRRAGVTPRLLGGAGERLPFRSASCDTVVMTLVLCAVRDPAAVLSEARRVLKPGGRLLFLEHVAAPAASRTRLAQAAAAPLWSLLAGGCRPDRDTPSRLAEAGFSRLEVEPFSVPVPIAGPHVTGFAER